MFARTLKVEVEVNGERRPCPLDWLDGFCMRRFTGNAAFDDTLPVGDGVLRAGFQVETEQLAAEFSQWLTRKKGNGSVVAVHISEEKKP